ncbi:MAG: PGF-CTERM sorting domain-containing protein [Halobacteriota archaeon]|nr:PGF-CTERM sorting domain-containing protein [Halobacteriota archaeon]
MIQKRLLLIAIALLSVSLVGTTAIAEDFGGCENEGCHADIAENFTTSLHYTGAGMKSEYEVGAAGHFGIDMDEYYSKWNCSNCHATTCEKCHEGGHGAEITIDTCDQCHFKKQTATFMGDMPVHKSKGPHADIHYEKGITCIDCHTAEEMHGDGASHGTMLEAVTTTCEDCHSSPGKTVKGMEVKQFSTEVSAHKTHEGKLDCTACHSGWMLTCENCHLDTRKGTTFDSTQYYLGVGADGKIKPFIKMTAMDEFNATHTGWAEWFPHTVTADAKDCAFCHENREVFCEGCEGKIMGKGGSFIPQEKIDEIYWTAAATEEPTVTETPTATEEPTPGFEAIFAITGLLAVAYLVIRYRR